MYKYFSAKAEAIFVGLVFPEIRVVCHFSLIVLIPTLNHAQWHKTLWWIRCHLCLCYSKGRCIIEKILQHFLRVFHKSVQAGWCWLTCRCLLGQLVQGLNWDTNLSSCVVNRCTSIHWKWVLQPFLWLNLMSIDKLVMMKYSKVKWSYMHDWLTLNQSDSRIYIWFSLPNIMPIHIIEFSSLSRPSYFPTWCLR